MSNKFKTEMNCVYIPFSCLPLTLFLYIYTVRNTSGHAIEDRYDMNILVSSIYDESGDHFYNEFSWYFVYAGIQECLKPLARCRRGTELVVWPSLAGLYIHFSHQQSLLSVNQADYCFTSDVLMAARYISQMPDITPRCQIQLLDGCQKVLKQTDCGVPPQFVRYTATRCHMIAGN